MGKRPPAQVLARLSAELISADSAEALWHCICGALTSAFEHQFVVASFSFARGTAQTMWRSRPAPQHPPQWWERNAATHPGMRWLAEHVGVRVSRVSDILPDTQLERHPYYREFMRAEGWHYSVGMFFWQRDQLVGMAAVNRSKQQGDFSAEDVALVDRMQRLIFRAWRRLEVATCEQQHTRALEAFLQQLPVGVLVVSRSREQVEFANTRSKELLAAWRGEQHLKLPDRLRMRDLPPALRRACLSPEADSTVACGSTQQLTARVRSVGSPDALFGANAALVTFDEPAHGQQQPSPAWLEALTHLSAREREVASLAATGLDNETIAARLSKSPRTVKKQLELVYRKLDVEGRVQLSALFAGLTSGQRRPRRASRAN